MKPYQVNWSADLYEAENTYYLRSPNGRMGKLLAHYDLYKRILGIPGAVAEFGVYKGASLMRFLAFRDLLENETSRPVYGFDAFGRFPVAEKETDDGRAFIDRFEGAGGLGIPREGLEEAISRKNMRNVKLVEGDIFDTLPKFLEERPEFRIALLHLDMDVYEPARFALDLLWPRMVKGGLIVFDDYGLVGGATQVADDFAESHGLALHKLPLYTDPAFFVR